MRHAWMLEKDTTSVYDFATHMDKYNLQIRPFIFSLCNPGGAGVALIGHIAELVCQALANKDNLEALLERAAELMVRTNCRPCVYVASVMLTKAFLL